MFPPPLTYVEPLCDLYYVGYVTSYAKGHHKRTDGKLFIGPNFVCRACSGRSDKFCLPDGIYQCHTFLPRTMEAMVRDGVGFSVMLSDAFDPELNRTRTQLLIHPDGGVPGTAGCVGILDRVAQCRDQLKKLFPPGFSRFLKVITVHSEPAIPATADKLLGL